MHKYRLIAKKGEGTFSEVLKAQSIKNGQYWAIKCMKNSFDNIDQVNNLREIQALKRLSPHPHIVTLFEVLYDAPSGHLALVFELLQMNFYELIRGRRHYLAENTLKMYMWQLLQAMDHMHRNGIFHRDIKPENVLILDDKLKVADFGSCRGIYSKQPFTEYISTRWYRAPECLLTDGYYGYKMDMWGVGCVMFEVAALYPLFPGANENDQIDRIHKVMGTPSRELLSQFKISETHTAVTFPQYTGNGVVHLLPRVSPEMSDLVAYLLRYDPAKRLSARQALRHAWFGESRQKTKRKKKQKLAKSGEVSRRAGEVEEHETVRMAGANVSGEIALPSIHGDGVVTTKPKVTNVTTQVTHHQAKAPKQSTRTQKAAKASARKKEVQGPAASQELPPIAKSMIIGTKKGNSSFNSTSPKKSYAYNSSSKKKTNTYRAAAKRVTKKASNKAKASAAAASVSAAATTTVEPSLSVGPITKRSQRRGAHQSATIRRDPSTYNKVKYNFHV